MDSKPKSMIYKVTWLPEDHVEELAEILNDVSSELLEMQLVGYVTRNIEPVGWKALWSCFEFGPLMPSKAVLPVNLIVYVVNVSLEKLEATIIILRVDDTDSEEDAELLDWCESIKQKEVNVPLVDLYVLADQDLNSIDIETTAEVLEQVRYEDILSGIIPKDIADEMNKLVEKGNCVLSEMEKIESNFERTPTSPNFDHAAIVDLMSLHKTMEEIKIRYNFLRDPFLRAVSLHQKHERGTLMMSSIKDESVDILVVAKVLHLDVFMTTMSELHENLNSLQYLPENPKVQVLPSLQMAIDVAKAGVVVALLPGIHTLTQMGELWEGGALIGLGNDVIIENNQCVGDILTLSLKNSALFLLKSVTLRPSLDQIAVAVHEGTILMNNCSIEGGRIGVQLLTGTCKLENCTFVGQQSHAIDVQSNSKISIQDTIFRGIEAAPVRVAKAATAEILGKFDEKDYKDCTFLLSGEAKFLTSSHFQKSLVKKELLN